MRRYGHNGALGVWAASVVLSLVFVTGTKTMAEEKLLYDFTDPEAAADWTRLKLALSTARRASRAAASSIAPRLVRTKSGSRRAASIAATPDTSRRNRESHVIITRIPRRVCSVSQESGSAGRN